MPQHGTVTWAAVILTGGTGARLEGTDKAALTHAGRTLLEIALDAVTEAAEVVVVGSEAATSRPVTFTRETPSYGGPLAGIAAGVAALADDHELVVVLAVDMPRVTRRTTARLLAAVGDGDAAWLVDATGRRQLAAAVRPGLVPAPGEATGVPVRALMGAGRSTDVPAVGDEATDVDTWPDVARLDRSRPGRDDEDRPHTRGGTS
jgi:molybdopterin-guanine dinucleotide biosynthesis protein A